MLSAYTSNTPCLFLTLCHVFSNWHEIPHKYITVPNVWWSNATHWLAAVRKWWSETQFIMGHHRVCSGWADCDRDLQVWVGYMVMKKVWSMFLQCNIIIYVIAPLSQLYNITMFLHSTYVWQCLFLHAVSGTILSAFVWRLCHASFNHFIVLIHHFLHIYILCKLHVYQVSFISTNISIIIIARFA